MYVSNPCGTLGQPQSTRGPNYPPTVVGNEGIKCGGGRAPIRTFSGWFYRAACQSIDGHGRAEDCAPLFLSSQAAVDQLASMLDEHTRIWLQPGMFQYASVNWAPTLEFMIPVGRPSYWKEDYWNGTLASIVWAALPPDQLIGAQVQGFETANRSLALTGVNLGSGWVYQEPWPCPNDVRDWREDHTAPGLGPITEPFDGGATVSVNRDGVYWLQLDSGESWQIMEGQRIVDSAFAAEGITPPAASYGRVTGISTWPVWAQEQGSMYRSFALESYELEGSGFPEPPTPPEPPEEPPNGNGGGGTEGENGEGGVDGGEGPGGTEPPNGGGDPGNGTPGEPGSDPGNGAPEPPTGARNELAYLAGAGLLLFLFTRDKR